MAIIQVTPDLLRGKAGEVRTLRGTHDETMTKLRNLVRALNDQWKGAAQDAFLQKFESMQPQFNNFSEMLEGYANLMDKAAIDLQQTDQNLQGTMNSFG